jgi:hypothetical protein
MKEPIIQHMQTLGMAVTRANYLKLAYFRDPPEELSAEQEAELPEIFQVDASEDFE